MGGRRSLEPWLTPLRPLIEDGTVDPVVAEAVPFDRAADAHRLIAERRNVGKVVLVPNARRSPPGAAR